MGSGFAKKKKEARLLQEKLQKMQEGAKKQTAKGTAGNGLVTLTLNGEHELTELKINPDCVDLEDLEGLEDLICAAHNEAVKKLSQSLPSFDNPFSKMGF